MSRHATTILLLCCCINVNATDWFDALKAGDDRALYIALHEMPKGGDLHNHSTGSVFVEDWYEMAFSEQDNGYAYYTKVRIEICREFADIDASYVLMFRNIEAAEFDSLNSCEQSEYARLEDLTPEQRDGWLNSIRLDSPVEGREEIFERHWHRPAIRQ